MQIRYCLDVYDTLARKYKSIYRLITITGYILLTTSLVKISSLILTKLKLSL